MDNSTFSVFYCVVAASRGVVFIILGINILPMIIGVKGIWLTVSFAECMTVIIGVHSVKKIMCKDSLKF